MIYPRLELLRELLSEDGSIWVSIDDNEGHYLKVVMDEIFVRKNFVASFIWQKRTSRENRAAVGSTHDYIYLHAPAGAVCWKEVRNLLPPTGEGYSNPDNDPKGPWRSIPFTAQGYRPNQMYDIVSPSGTNLQPPRGRCWAATEPVFRQLLVESKIYFPRGGAGRPRVKQYPDGVKGLVPMTFWEAAEVEDTEEANAYVQPGQLHLPGEDEVPLLVYKPEEPLRLLVREAVDLSVFSPEEREKVRQVEKEPGVYELEVIGAIPKSLQEKIVRIVPEDRKIEVTRALQRHRYAQQRPPSPAERGEKFQVPRLCLWVQGELEPAEKDLFLDAGGWNLLDFPATLTEAEFAVNESARTFEVDVQGKRVVYGLVNGSHQLDLGHLRTEWTDLELARWLDREVRQTDVRQEVLLEFLRRMVVHLTETRKIGLDTLVRGKFVLAKTLREKIAACRQQRYEHGYQETLFGPRAAVETSYRFTFDFPKDQYPAREPYKGSYKFGKHYYPFVGELESTGEEFECVRLIDGLQDVKHWVRNLALQPAFSFWLPTSTDRFYPDFVAELEDGRILVVEYKGELYADSADTREKRNLGALWEEKSGGKGLFLMAEKRDVAGRDLSHQLADKFRR
jgi:hypothetical protein